MPSEGRRALRVADLLRERLTGAMRTELSDPLIVSVVITSLEVTDDLGVARVGVRLLVGDERPEDRKQVIRHLQRASGRLARAVSPGLRLRKVPELRFHYDAAHDAERRVDELLREIARDDEQKPR